ncbi:hypothetical protein HNY73_019541 [Argiope bruennichi]|uniref:C2H2-type domain-containing protein n=1 Tax=Argiope bruennichi TaxID=94029 RepID=A0A8T0E4P5_ARGBR|nr:hypothetical protein HNY73_019541 [Argiope bruennichi]
MYHCSQCKYVTHHKGNFVKHQRIHTVHVKYIGTKHPLTDEVWKFGEGCSSLGVVLVI